MTLKIDLSRAPRTEVLRSFGVFPQLDQTQQGWLTAQHLKQGMFLKRNYASGTVEGGVSANCSGWFRWAIEEAVEGILRHHLD